MPSGSELPPWPGRSTAAIRQTGLPGGNDAKIAPASGSQLLAAPVAPWIAKTVLPLHGAAGLTRTKTWISAVTPGRNATSSSMMFDGAAEAAPAKPATETNEAQAAAKTLMFMVPPSRERCDEATARGHLESPPVRVEIDSGSADQPFTHRFGHGFRLGVDLQS